MNKPAAGFVWMVAWPDLVARARRFLITAVGMALILAVTLLLSGFSEGFNLRATRLLDAFVGDHYVVAEGAIGPFTSFAPLPIDAMDQMELEADAMAPALLVRTGVGGTNPLGVMAAGIKPDSFLAPRIVEGFALRGPGEVVLDTEGPPVAIGDTVDIGGVALTVVGRTEHATIDIATSVVYMDLGQAQELFAQGAPVVSTIVTRGAPASVPDGLEVQTRQQAFDDLLDKAAAAKDSIDSFKFTLWALAAVIVGAVLYLAALERVRDFAILKATGASNADLVLGLCLQSVIIALVASAFSVVLANLMKPIYPGIISMPLAVIWPVPLIAVVIALIGSFVGIRRAISVDPSQAFG